MQNKAIFLMGPTAVGKTELALRLGVDYPIEIISVDSALIYRDLNIGSAKPTAEEMARVPHHLIDILSPLDNYSVADFLRACNQEIIAINQRGNLPILVGGTMMYYNALINGISQLPEADLSLREQLTLEFRQVGNLAMHQRLVELDPICAAKIEANDIQRVQRALEVCILTGKPMSLAQQEHKLPGLTNCNYLPLAIIPTNRELLHQRINLRFEQMLQQGFINEVVQLQLKYPNLSAEHNSMRCVGYRQVWDYLAVTIDLTQLREQGMAATRQLAKRQITWLRSMDVIAIDDPALELANLEQQIKAQLKNFIND
ncbi:MAG TPA: tRNA (adenosine(37)-N6)-dimethylallyltransferase MiaA [Neisseriales bacterium]|jgi:tRNA dimethylallyltransferase|nr:tRNA (adenosine(37)-N6)-dimethylallyltransferase MiaA [Neisseriales bacterium]